MRRPRGRGSRVTFGAPLVVLGIALAGCGTVTPYSSAPPSAGGRAGATSSSPRAGPSASKPPPSSPRSAPLPRSSPSATPGQSAGVTITVGSGDNGRTVVLVVGENLVVTLPNPSEREITHEMVRSSDLSILELLSADQSMGSSMAVLRVPFRALRVGMTAVRATGVVPFEIQVEVVAS